MTSEISAVLLLTTLVVRWRIALHDRRGFMLDLATVPLWTYFYASVGAYPLIVIPYVFAYLDVMALQKWWKPTAEIQIFTGDGNRGGEVWGDGGMRERKP